ncbi:hypothetical protein T484DRAFT_2716905 [Baffinella frigidus]|nr:hypothetical protein T484DRAFT_2716905 [Cryptophyta sp. CCMP2293]
MHRTSLRSGCRRCSPRIFLACRDPRPRVLVPRTLQRPRACSRRCPPSQLRVKLLRRKSSLQPRASLVEHRVSGGSSVRAPLAPRPTDKHRCDAAEKQVRQQQPCIVADTSQTECRPQFPAPQRRKPLLRAPHHRSFSRQTTGSASRRDAAFTQHRRPTTSHHQPTPAASNADPTLPQHSPKILFSAPPGPSKK